MRHGHEDAHLVTRDQRVADLDGHQLAFRAHLQTHADECEMKMKRSVT
jgi:hypothetical protein